MTLHLTRIGRIQLYDKSLPTFELYSIEGGAYDFTDNLAFADNQDGVYNFLTSIPELDMEKMDVIPMCTMRYCGKTILFQEVCLS